MDSGIAVAKYTYSFSEPQYLSLTRGDQVRVIKRVDAWTYCQFGEKVGYLYFVSTVSVVIIRHRILTLMLRREQMKVLLMF